MKEDMIIPRRVTIETIFGCNAHCNMCVIDQPTTRKKGVMSQELFKKIVDELMPYREHLEMFDLFGLGEPLLDPHIFERVQYVKEKGFKNLAFSTNADLLDEKKQRKLLETGIDSVLFSVDGIDKETHERIRRGVSFERVIANILGIIKMRNEGDYKTRFIVRSIIQDSNRDGWERYYTFWKSKLSEEKNDMLIKYNLHSWGGAVFSKDTILGNSARDPEIEKQPCHHFLENLYILADGTLPLCHEDALCAQYADMDSNARDRSPIEAFNSPIRQWMRKVHLAGRKDILSMCKECTILYSEKERIKL